MENLPEHIDELIAKFLAGEATPGEKSMLDQWLSASDENKRYFRSLEILFRGAAAGNQKQKFDTDAAWDALKEKIRRSSSQSSTASAAKRSVSWYWKAAAAIVLIMAVGYLLFRQEPENPIAITVESGPTTLQDTLPDGSTAFLNTSSVLEYNYVPQDHSRRIKLEGEAFFEVSHVEDSQFIIECTDIFIEDIGTAFNVRAYSGSPAVEVYVESGEVAFYSASDAGVHLTAGETGVYDRQTRTFVKSELPDKNVLAYKTRVFSFSDMDLRSIVESLNRVYPTKVRLGNEQLGNCRLNVTFMDESIDSIADIIAETLGLSATKGNGEIILEGTGCGL